MFKQNELNQFQNSCVTKRKGEDEGVWTHALCVNKVGKDRGFKKVLKIFIFFSPIFNFKLSTLSFEF